MPPPPVPYEKPRLWLAAALCLLAAVALVPQVRAATFARNEDMVDMAYVAMALFCVAAFSSLMRKELIAGALLVCTVVGVSYLSLEKRPWFVFDEVVWGVIPPCLLAAWQLAHARVRATAYTFVGAALWCVGFAVKFLHAHQWRV